MRLTVLLFAGVRAQLGVDRLEVEVEGPVTVAELRERLLAAHPQIGSSLPTCRIALDHEFADESDLVREGMDVALIPPVSGGHDGSSPEPVDQRGQRSRLTSSPLSLAELIAAVEHRNAGGLTTFTGNVREASRGKIVTHLEYEAYPAMAVASMDAIALAVEEEIAGTRIALAHRVGRLEVGEAAVMIAASAPHRDEAFRACREVIERLKRDVPIWKKEFDAAGGEWIGQGP